MVAYHFPPILGSSGVHRTASFVRYLPEHGWKPIVLTVTPAAYPAIDSGADVDFDGAVIRRTLAIDSQRHLSIHGKYAGWLALPDRWISWWLSAVPAGLALIRRHRPHLVWSTYPIPTAHLIGEALSRLTRRPWVADFRDSMYDDSFPTDAPRRRAHRWVEQRTITRCRYAVFTTEGTRRMYTERYPRKPGARLIVIPNGYDEAAFAAVEARSRRRVFAPSRRLTLVHSGVLYPSERDPRPFFAALDALRRRGMVAPARLRVILRGASYEAYLRDLVQKHDLQAIVELAPVVPYPDALEEMVTADGLLLFQAANCNHQVPAKLYEYLRARRPILALTDPDGDTAAVLRDAGTGTIARLDSAQEIERALPRFLERCAGGVKDLLADTAIGQFSRRTRAADLAALFERIGDTAHR